MKQTAILVPIDNRPITFLFPQYICQLSDLEVLTPPREFMGSLSEPTDIENLWNWLETTIAQVKDGILFVCLDSLLYGGLIPSRRSNDNLETILARLERISRLKKIAKGNLRIYAQSSIMRISDNYDNTEEKLYWSKYGREIFCWSALLHKEEMGILEAKAEREAIELKINPEIRNDYLNTRKRNFLVNQKIIDYALNKHIDYLIFSQDDSGTYGLNVSEKNQLTKLIQQKKVNACAYAGADEVLMSLVAYYLNHQRQTSPNIIVEYSSPTSKVIASNYEGQTISDSLQYQAHAQSLEIVPETIEKTTKPMDFTIIVHTSSDKQGDHIWLPGLVDLRNVDTKKSAEKAIELIEQSKTPVVICDVAYSNGSDPVFIDLLLQKPHLFKKIWSYAGWNTTGNTIGNALAVGSACLVAGDHLNNKLRLSLLWLRLMDDWAYQTQVRPRLMATKSTNQSDLSQLMTQYATLLSIKLGFKPQSIDYAFPWNRTFEVEIATILP